MIWCSMVSCGMSANHPVAIIYNGCFVPSSLSIQLFLTANAIPYRLINDRDMEGFQFLPEHRLFIFPAGHCFEKVPANAFGGSRGISRFKRAISDGMNYLGICAGAFAALEKSYYPIDISLKLIHARHRWPGETGAGTQMISIRMAESIASSVNTDSQVQPVWYHNGPIIASRRGDDYKVLAVFEPTAAEREQSRENLLFRKQLSGTPAIIEANYGRGRVVACSPHPELGDMGVRQYQSILRQWLQYNGYSDTGVVDPLADGEPGNTHFLQTLGGDFMQPVIHSRNWRLLRTIVDDLLR